MENGVQTLDEAVRGHSLHKMKPLIRATSDSSSKQACDIINQGLFISSSNITQCYITMVLFSK